MPVCSLCNLSEEDNVMYGEFLTKKNISVHTFCLYLSSNLAQRGNDNEGILGFLLQDIQAERARVQKLNCFICNNPYANVGCCAHRCRKTFHSICGFKNGCQNQFLKSFRSFCPSHKKKINRYVCSSKDNCLICFEAMLEAGERFNHITMINTPCCRNGFFHKRCLQEYANASGYFCKCPLCNDKNNFCYGIQHLGIFIPQRDAAWELEPNAYADLYQRPNKCSALECLNWKGREEDSDSDPFTFCHTCGGHAIHENCLKREQKHKKIYNCQECSPLINNDSGRESMNSTGNQVNNPLNDNSQDETEDEVIDVCEIDEITENVSDLDIIPARSVRSKMTRIEDSNEEISSSESVDPLEKMFINENQVTFSLPACSGNKDCTSASFGIDDDDSTSSEDDLEQSCIALRTRKRRSIKIAVSQNNQQSIRKSSFFGNRKQTLKTLPTTDKNTLCQFVSSSDEEDEQQQSKSKLRNDTPKPNRKHRRVSSSEEINSLKLTPKQNANHQIILSSDDEDFGEPKAKMRKDTPKPNRFHLRILSSDEESSAESKTKMTKGTPKPKKCHRRILSSDEESSAEPKAKMRKDTPKPNRSYFKILSSDDEDLDGPKAKLRKDTPKPNKSHRRILSSDEDDFAEGTANLSKDPPKSSLSERTLSPMEQHNIDYSKISNERDLLPQGEETFEPKDSEVVKENNILDISCIALRTRRKSCSGRILSDLNNHQPKFSTCQNLGETVLLTNVPDRNLLSQESCSPYGTEVAKENKSLDISCIALRTRRKSCSERILSESNSQQSTASNSRNSQNSNIEKNPLSQESNQPNDLKSSKQKNILDISCIALRTRRKSCSERILGETYSQQSATSTSGGLVLDRNSSSQESNPPNDLEENSKQNNILDISCIALRTRRKSCSERILGCSGSSQPSNTSSSQRSQENLCSSNSGDSPVLSQSSQSSEASSCYDALDISCIAKRTRRRQSQMSSPIPVALIHVTNSLPANSLKYNEPFVANQINRSSSSSQPRIRLPKIGVQKSFNGRDERYFSCESDKSRESSIEKSDYQYFSKRYGRGNDTNFYGKEASKFVGKTPKPEINTIQSRILQTGDSSKSFQDSGFHESSFGPNLTPPPTSMTTEDSQSQSASSSMKDLKILEKDPKSLENEPSFSVGRFVRSFNYL